MKKHIIIITLLFASMVNGQTLKDLIAFKAMPIHTVEKELTQEGWVFKRHETSKDLFKTSISKTRKVNASITYEHKESSSRLTISNYKTSNKNNIEILSKSDRVYNNILQDLLKANFNKTDEKSPYTDRYLGDFNPEKKLNLESQGSVYRKETHEIHLVVYKREIVVDKFNEKYSYDQNVITNQYLIIVK